MAWSRDTRKPTRFMRGARRYNDVGGHSPPGDELENTRDHERIWFELRRTRSCCDCDSPGFKYCFQTFDYPSYICDGDFPGGDTLAGYWPGVRKDIGLSDGIAGSCGAADLINTNLFTLAPHENGSWRNGPYVVSAGSELDLVSAVGWTWANKFPNQNWTLEFWLKPSSSDIDGGARLVLHGIGGETLSQGGLDVSLRSGGGIGLQHIQVAGGAMQESGAGWFEADQWHHVAVVRSTVARTVAIFVNGRIAISRVIPTTGWAVNTFPSTPSFAIVKNCGWSDIGAYTSALSPTTIRRHYQAVYGVEGAANPLASIEGDPTQVEDPTVVITEQISIDLIDGGGDGQAGSVAISQGAYAAWVTPEDSPFELEARKGQADGYAALDSGAHVPSAQLGAPSLTGVGFLREDERWIDGRLPSLPETLEQRLLSWYENPADYVAALPSYFNRRWLLDGDAVPFPDSASGQSFTSGTFTVDEFGAFGDVSCPVFSGGTDGLATAAVAAASENFAFAFWVRVDALPASEVNLIKCGSTFGVRLNPDGTIEMWTGGTVRATTVATVTVGQWHHVWADHDAVGLQKSSRIGLDGVLVSGTTSFGSGNGSGYQIAGDGFEGAISVAAASDTGSDGGPDAAAILALATGHRSLDWSAYSQNAAIGGVNASEDDVPVTASPRTRVNFKAGANVSIDVVDDAGGDEVEVTIGATSPAGSGIEVSEAGVDVTASPRGRLDFVASGGATVDVADDGANDKAVVTIGVPDELPDTAGHDSGDVLTLDSLLAPAWAAPSGGGGGGGYGVEPAAEPPALPHACDDEFDGPSLDPKWAWTNQGSAAASLDLGSLVLDAPQNGGVHSWRILYQAFAPAGDFTIIAKVTAGTYPVNSHYSGLVLWNSANDRRIIWGPTQFNAASPNPRGDRWTSASVYSASPSGNLTFWEPRYYLRVRKVGTDLKFDVSVDGITWLWEWTESIGTFLLAVDRIGFGVNPFGGRAMKLGVDFVRVTEP